MPPRWPRKPDRRDPAFRRVGDRINFAVHVALFGAVNSGLWFAHQINPVWVPWVATVTGVWLVPLIGHAVYIFAIADYSGTYTPEPETQEGQ
ncbi:MAG: 2TM domain-containing protein [Leptolyngbyaceae cyanobacterium]